MLLNQNSVCYVHSISIKQLKYLVACLVGSFCYEFSLKYSDAIKMFCGRDCLAQPLYIISWHHLIIYLTCTLYVYTQNESALQELLEYLQNVLLISSCFYFIILRAFNLILKLLCYFSHLGFMFKQVLILILNFSCV